MINRSMVQNAEKKWRLYERLIAALQAENVGIEISVTPNAQLVGEISGRVRQIDVLLDARWGDDISRRIMIDAKLYKSKLDIKDVESFEGMMKDCRAQRGILICQSGWTQGALRRAQDSINLKLISIEELEQSNSWAHFHECSGQCNIRKNNRGLVLLDGEHTLYHDNFWIVIFTGKCDVCHNFHVWCWDCGEIFALSDEDEYECSCKRKWVTAIEEDVNSPTKKILNAVHLILGINDQWSPLDRRMLR